MDWTALFLSFELGAATLVILLPIAYALAYALAFGHFRGRGLVEALVALPLVLPPTVVGFYFLTFFGARSFLGGIAQRLLGHPLVFSFAGLLLASLLVNLPFAVQPIENALGAIPRNVREAARCSGLAPWRIIWRIEIPLAWPGILTATVLSFAHSLGEFGVVLMVGGSIPGKTKTIALSIYDRVQAFDDRAAGQMALLLLLISLCALALTNVWSRRIGRRDAV